MSEELLEQTIEQNIEPEVPEISLDAMREGKIHFSKLPKEEKVRLTREAREQLDEEEAKEAWDMGWRSKEFFGGKAKDGSEREFIDHKAFLEKISQNAPVQNERLKTLREREMAKDRELEEMKQEMRKLTEISKMNFERSLQGESLSLDAQIKEAREYGDFDRYDELQAKKQELQSNTLKLKQYEPAPEQPRLAPEVQADLEEWGTRNQWYYQDIEMQNYAKKQAEILNKDYPHIPFSQRLDKVSELTKTFYSERFPKELKAPPVLPASKSGSFSGNKKVEIGFSSLPESEKHQARQMIRLGVFKDEVDFIKSYHKIIK